MRIKSTRVWVDEKLQPKVVEFEGNKIVSILDYSEEADKDYGDHMILPGFIEIHSHGYAGVHANDASNEGLQIWSDSLISEGVTSYLATTSTQDYNQNLVTLKAISEYMKVQDKGARVIGANVEGNFICDQYSGAQNKNYIVEPDPQVLRDYIEASNHTLKSVICAVEEDKDLEFTKEAVKNNVALSIGHTNATFDEAMAAIKVGATGVTHTGNGMRPFHHREPGIFGAALTQDKLYAEVIVDGHHLHFETVNVIGTMKGKDKLILVTDSSSYKDYDGVDEDYVRVIGEDGTIRTPEGNLSGSNLRFNDGVYNAINKARLPFVTVINASTINPAKYLKMDHKGLIQEGMDADLIVVDDNFKVKDAYVLGAKQ